MCDEYKVLSELEPRYYETNLLGYEIHYWSSYLRLTNVISRRIKKIPFSVLKNLMFYEFINIWRKTDDIDIGDITSKYHIHM